MKINKKPVRLQKKPVRIALKKTVRLPLKAPTRLDYYMKKEGFVKSKSEVWCNPFFLGQRKPRLLSNRLYVCSGLSNIPKNRKKSFLRQLESIGEQADSFGLVSIVPHRDTDVEKMAHVPARVVKEIDIDKVQHSGLLVADMSYPTTGGGQELRAAEEYGIPVIMAMKRGTYISRMPIGIENVSHVFEYDSPQDLHQKLGGVLSGLLGKPSLLRLQSAQRQRLRERKTVFSDW